jgi:hypothetical protein
VTIYQVSPGKTGQAMELRVLRALSSGPQSLSNIGVCTGYEFSTIHVSLRRLREKGDCCFASDGRWIITEQGMQRVDTRREEKAK